MKEEELIVDLIKKLTKEEGSHLTIVNENPDCTGPNNLILISIDCGQTERPIFGDSLLECLKQAADELNTQRE